MPVQNLDLGGRLIFYHYWCWRTGGAAPVEPNTGNYFPNAREFPEIDTVHGETITKIIR